MDIEVLTFITCNLLVVVGVVILLLGIFSKKPGGQKLFIVLAMGVAISLLLATIKAVLPNPKVYIFVGNLTDWDISGPYFLYGLIIIATFTFLWRALRGGSLFTGKIMNTVIIILFIIFLLFSFIRECNNPGSDDPPMAAPPAPKKESK